MFDISFYMPLKMFNNSEIKVGFFEARFERLFVLLFSTFYLNEKYFNEKPLRSQFTIIMNVKTT